MYNYIYLMSLILIYYININDITNMNWKYNVYRYGYLIV